MSAQPPPQPPPQPSGRDPFFTGLKGAVGAGCGCLLLAVLIVVILGILGSLGGSS